MESKVKGAICSLQEDVKNHINILSLTSWNTQLIINLVIMASRVGDFLWKCRMWKILCLAHPIFFFFFFFWKKKIDIKSLLGMCVYVTELKGRKCFILKPGCHWLLLTKWARVFHANRMNNLFDSVHLSSTMFFYSLLPRWRKRDVGKKLIVLMMSLAQDPELTNAAMKGTEVAECCLRGESEAVTFSWMSNRHLKSAFCQ